MTVPPLLPSPWLLAWLALWLLRKVPVEALLLGGALLGIAGLFWLRPQPSTSCAPTVLQVDLEGALTACPPGRVGQLRRLSQDELELHCRCDLPRPVAETTPVEAGP